MLQGYLCAVSFNLFYTLNSRSTMKRITFFLCAWLLSVGTLPAQTVTNSIAVGGVTSDSAKFWIRLSGAGTVNVQLSLASTFTSPLSGTAVSVSGTTNNAGVVKVGGLAANTKYFYRAVVGGTPVADGKTRSFSTFPVPTDASGTFSFAFGSCQQSGSLLPSATRAGNVFGAVAKANPKFFLQIGDWAYPDSTDNIPASNLDFFPSQFSRVQASYLARFKSDYPIDTLLSLAPIDYVWDDHDYMNDNASANTSSFFVPRKLPPSNDFTILEIPNPGVPGNPVTTNARLNSIAGYKEQFPGYALQNESRGVYHRFKYGKDVEVFAVDLRAQRSGNLNALKKDTVTGSPTNGKWLFVPPAGHSIIGRDAAPGTGESQLTWFLNSLKTSTAKWKFVMSSVPFNLGQRAGIDLGIALQDVVTYVPGIAPGPPLFDTVSVIFGAMEFSDKWVGFPSDVDTLLSTIRNTPGIGNVIMLSGDSHNAAIHDTTVNGARITEMMAGGLDITNSKIVSLLKDSFGLNIWNKGGQGINNANFNNAFGKVTVFGTDSVRLDLVDEFEALIASHTVTANMSSASEKAPRPLPTRFELGNNYPNPFNPATTFFYSLPQAAEVKVEVYDVLGKKVATLVNERKTAGVYTAVFNATGLASGAYFYKMTATGSAGSQGSFTQTRKMTLIK